MKETIVRCDNCGEKCNSQYLELVVHLGTIAEPRDDVHYDICGVECLHSKTDMHFQEVMVRGSARGELPVEFSINRIEE